MQDVIGCMAFLVCKNIKWFCKKYIIKILFAYLYRYDLNWNLTLKDKIVHKQLCSSINVPPDMFLMCQLSHKANEANSTHSYRQVFNRFYMHTFVPVPMHIVNMAERNFSYQGSLPTTPIFKDILSSLKMNIKKTQGVVAILKIEDSLENQMDKMVEELAQSEKEMNCLEDEIYELKQNLRRQQALQRNNIELWN